MTIPKVISTPVTVCAIAGGAAGAYIEHKNGVNFLPISGGIAGAMLGGAAALLCAAQYLNDDGSQQHNQYYLSAPETAQSSDMLFYLGNALMHVAATVAATKFVHKHKEQINKFAKEAATDLGWVYRSTHTVMQQASNTVRSYIS